MLAGRREVLNKFFPSSNVKKQINNSVSIEQKDNEEALGKTVNLSDINLKHRGSKPKTLLGNLPNF